MNFQELTQSRRTIQHFTHEPVDASLVETALKLSLWAPNHRLTWPWIYYWLGPESRLQLATLAVDLKSAKAPVSEIKRQAIEGSVLNPAHMIMIGVKRSSIGQMHEDYATLACSMQIVCTSLWESRVGTKWSTGAFTMHPKTYDILQVDPEQVKLEGALLVGVPQSIPEAQSRPDLSEHLQHLP